MQAPAGGPPGVRAQGRKGDDGSREACPPPCRGTGDAPRACAVLATGQRHECNEGNTTSPPPPPPTHHRPPKGGGCRKGGADSGRPSRGQSGKTGRQRGEGAGRTTRPCPREARAVQAPAGGAPGERTQSGKGDDGGQAACPTPQQKDKCRATCLRRACNVLTPEEGQRGRPPLPTPNSHTHQGKGRGEGEGTWGMTVAGIGPPPPRTPRQGGEAVERECGTNHTTVQREHAPCKPQRGDHRGCDRRKGRVTTGATRQAPPLSGGTSAAPRACAVLATCLHYRADSEDAPPPPRPLLLNPATKRARQTETPGKKKTKNKQQKTPTRQSRGRQQGQTGHGGSQGTRQGARDRGTPLGTKARRQGPTPQRTGGGAG